MSVGNAELILLGNASSTGIVGQLQSILSGAIPVLFPVMITVSVLFGGYWILKKLYHKHF